MRASSREGALLGGVWSCRSTSGPGPDRGLTGFLGSCQGGSHDLPFGSTSHRRYRNGLRPRRDRPDREHWQVAPSHQDPHALPRSRPTMRRSSRGSSAIGLAEETAEVIALPTALARETSSAPATPRRAVAYVRESTEEQGKGFSPEGQRQAIASYAREHGFELLTSTWTSRADARSTSATSSSGSSATQARTSSTPSWSSTPHGSRETRSRPSTTRSSCAQNWASKSSRSPSHSATPTTPPRSSPSRSTRSSMSTTPSRSRSGPRWASRRRPAKGS
jgi:hypothetical protein